MQLQRVSGIGRFEGELMGYNVLQDKVVCLTEKELSVVWMEGQPKRRSTSLRGERVLNFALGKRGYIALLFRNRSIEVRRLDRLGEVVCRFANVAILESGIYPKLRWDYEDLYLLYPDSLQILSAKDRSRRGYTDILSDYENEQLGDLLIANVMDSQRAVILQLRHRLLFTIVPIPVAELPVPAPAHTLTLHSSQPAHDSKREYVVVLSGRTAVRVYNIVSLKQLAEMELAAGEKEFVELEGSAGGESVLVRFVDEESMEVTRSQLLKVNPYYYLPGNYFTETEPFFLYHIDIPLSDNLSLLPARISQTSTIHRWCFFREGELWIGSQTVPNIHSQPPRQLGLAMHLPIWCDVPEWREIMGSYLQLSSQTQPPRLDYSEQERQVYEYNMVKDEFDTIIGKFAQYLNSHSGVAIDIEQQWNAYLLKVAEERNFLPETMQLFRIEPQKSNNHPPQFSIELQQCVMDLQGRDSRIDNCIARKRQEILQEQSKIKLEIKQKEADVESKPKLTPEEIQQYEEEYRKFVEEFMADSRRKEQEEKEAPKVTSEQSEQRITLALPVLNEQERKLIHNQLLDSSQSHSESPENKVEQEKAWIQMQAIIASLHSSLQPLQSKLDQLSLRLDDIQQTQLEKIKQSEALLEQQSKIDLQAAVKGGVRRMLEGLHAQVKKGIETTTQKLCRLQDRNLRYYEESIAHFKEFIKFQLEHRVALFYRSRQQLETSLSQAAQQERQSQKQQ